MLLFTYICLHCVVIANRAAWSATPPNSASTRQMTTYGLPFLSYENAPYYQYMLMLLDLTLYKHRLSLTTVTAKLQEYLVNFRNGRVDFMHMYFIPENAHPTNLPTMIIYNQERIQDLGWGKHGFGTRS